MCVHLNCIFCIMKIRYISVLWKRKNRTHFTSEAAQTAHYTYIIWHILSVHWEIGGSRHHSKWTNWIKSTHFHRFNIVFLFTFTSVWLLYSVKKSKIGIILVSCKRGDSNAVKLNKSNNFVWEWLRIRWIGGARETVKL